MAAENPRTTLRPSTCRHSLALILLVASEMQPCDNLRNSTAHRRACNPATCHHTNSKPNRPSAAAVELHWPEQACCPGCQSRNNFGTTRQATRGHRHLSKARVGQVPAFSIPSHKGGLSL